MHTATSLTNNTMRTAYGIIIVPDGRVLLKRAVVYSHINSKQTGLWHLSLSRRAVQHSAKESLKIALFTEFGVKRDTKDVIITPVTTTRVYEVFGKLIIYTIKFNKSINLKLSFKTEIRAMWPSELIKNIEEYNFKYMPDGRLALKATEHLWKEIFDDIP